ncbi:MAG: NADH-quinone oxidoreductase subunit NuoF [Candidatus Sumerlaeia bacterium]|nr:NADH-quinone oxidoreductase subunit NuoF [Candidatus Sumerlaeia bacterium]
MAVKGFLSALYEQPDMHRLAVAQERANAYAQARRVITMEPAAVIDAVKAANLKGLGGAGFPTGMKWSFVPPKGDKPHYLVVNADEGEPGTFKDRRILLGCPHALLEGIIICCHAIRSEKAYIYVRGEYIHEMKRLQGAIDEAYAAGLLGADHLGTGRRLDVVVHPGAGAYICGEETALIESLEGKKGQPRNKPPFPAIEGLFMCPTVVNNVETLSYLPFLFEMGPQAFNDLGANGTGGCHLVSLSGHIERPGVYEVPMGFPMMELINGLGGGVWKSRRLKAVIPGGLSAPILTADEAQQARLDFKTLRDMGSMAGSGAVMVIDDETPMINVLLNCSHFYHDESCGQCTPCRDGSWWLYKICLRIARGEGRVRDLDEIVRICNNIEGNTICAFGEATAWPIRSYVRKFRGELEAFIQSGQRASEADWYHDDLAAPPLVQIAGVAGTMGAHV